MVTIQLLKQQLEDWEECRELMKKRKSRSGFRLVFSIYYINVLTFSFLKNLVKLYELADIKESCYV